MDDEEEYCKITVNLSYSTRTAARVNQLQLCPSDRIYTTLFSYIMN